jgi:hypothetical protein
MPIPVDQEEEERVILRRLHECSRPYVSCLSWCRDNSDARTIQHHASCFAVEVAGNLFGVTAKHVVEQYQSDQNRYGDMHLRFHDEDLALSLLDVGLTADIATFRVERSLLERTGRKHFAYRAEEWPPHPPERGKGIVLTGFPRQRRRIANSREVIYEQVSNCLVVDDVHFTNMTMKVKAKHLRSIDGEVVPSFSEDVGGYSGAPVLTVSSGLELFRLGGVLYEGALRCDDDGEFLDFKAEPISWIRSDGRLNAMPKW